MPSFPIRRRITHKRKGPEDHLRQRHGMDQRFGQAFADPLRHIPQTGRQNIPMSLIQNQSRPI